MQDTATSRDDVRFAFGRNWSAYAESLTPDRMEQAKAGLRSMLEPAEIKGRSWLDIGCGSGVHALAALRLGASRLVAIDADEFSVSTTRAVLDQHAPEKNWTASQRDVLDMSAAKDGLFDVVYSWGVLHHTGNLAGAMEKTCELVAPGGLLAVALYRRTRLDPFWLREKRWYASTSPRTQRVVQRLYLGMLATALTLSGRSYRRYRDDYHERRGMSLVHDVHDWLGGYPYESISADEVRRFYERRGFTLKRSNARPTGLGIFGSGCDEFVFRCNT
ncbi:MAG: class I SAM-dependent methyltransferase [Pseudomonadota bacterium]|nr:class I SAM-dependent methyltransferase [Pseudomonadota bacterium]